MRALKCFRSVRLRLQRVFCRAGSGRFVAAGILCLLALGCATPGPLPTTADPSMRDDERMLWRTAVAEEKALDGSGLLYRDGPLEDYLARVAGRIQPSGLQDKIPFKVFVIKDPYLNAFAFPNGVIYIHSGILARMDNEAQLAALLGHEISHCTHRHALRAFRSFKNRPALVAAVEQTLANLKMVQNVARFLGMTGFMAAVSGYPVEFETEADTAGLDLVVKAGYNPYEALHLFEHLKQEIAREGMQEPYFFGTHPKVQNRIDNLTGLLAAKYPDKKTGITHTDQFLAKVQGILMENARLNLKLGRFSAARREVEKYLRIRPDDARAYFLWGEICRQRAQGGDVEKAVGYYQKAILLDPSYADPHKALGLIYYKQGRKILAREHFKTCLSLAPDISDGAYLRQYLQLCVANGEG